MSAIDNIPIASRPLLAGVPFDQSVEVAMHLTQGFHVWDKTPKGSKDPSLCQGIFQLPGGALFWQSKMAIDADGSPTQSVLDSSSGSSPHTSLQFTHPVGAINPEVVPYFVLPKHAFEVEFGVKLGTLGVVIFGDKITGAIFADEGPTQKIGEASIRVHELIVGPKAPWKDPVKKIIRDVSVEKGVVFFLFPRARFDIGKYGPHQQKEMAAAINEAGMAELARLKVAAGQPHAVMAAAAAAVPPAVDYAGGGSNWQAIENELDGEPKKRLDDNADQGPIAARVIPRLRAKAPAGRVLVMLDSGDVGDGTLKDAVKVATTSGCILSIYVEGPGGPTGKRWSADEKRRVRARAKAVMSAADANNPDFNKFLEKWDNRAWWDYTKIELAKYGSDGYAACEIDNISRAIEHFPDSFGKFPHDDLRIPKATVALFKEYAIEHGKGKLPDLIMKNLDVQTLGQVKTAIDAGTLPRAMFADLHIAEEDSDDHPDQQGAATADVGIQILRSRDTEHYHAHGMYDHAGLDARRAAAWAKAAPAPVHAMVAATLTAEQFACAGSGDPEDAPEGAALGSTMMGAVPVKPPIDQIESTTHKSSRNGGKIDHIVIHYTGSRNVNGVIEHFKNGTPRVSAHYIVGQDGRLVQMVPDAEKAWHAGSASMNARSIGIEHAAEKHDTIAADQAAKSLALIKWLMSVHAIPASQIIPHCCVHQTDCCGDLFRDFGGGLGLSCDKQSAALRKWLAANGIAAHAVTAQADDRDGPPNVVGLLEARHTPPPVAPAVRPGQTVMAWEDDPDSGAPPRAVPVPNAAGSPLPFSLPNAPAPGNFPQRTREFRYWAAAEALTRGAEFWAPKLPQPPRWHTTVGAVMPVNLDAGNDLNAFYDRVSLQFFHGKGVGGDVFSGESPDVVCHELGHAVLDSLKPQLFDAASHEAAAFHESFGDMSAIMSALQIPSLRAAVLSETDTRLARNSRLSRLAEQLGSAIRLRRPDAVDADCLRNAANSLIYQNPLDLPFDAPATQLSSEAHSFSRVFTAAFLQALAGLADVRAAGARPGDADLQAVAVDLGNILVRGIRLAAVVPGFYAQVAAGMVEASRSVNPGYPGVLKEVFVRRGILPMNFAAVADDLQAAAGIAASHLSAAAMDQDLDPVAVDGRQFGLELDRLVLHAPTQPRRLSISAVTVDRRGAPAVSSDTAARAFASDLFQKGRVAMPAGTTRAGVASSGIPPERRHTHEIRVEGDIQVLRRRHFDCGFCEH